MKGDLNEQLRQRVLDGGSFASQHFHRDETERLLDGRGLDVKRWSSIAWSLLCLEIWWDRYRSELSAVRRLSDAPPALATASA